VCVGVQHRPMSSVSHSVTKSRSCCNLFYVWSLADRMPAVHGATGKFLPCDSETTTERWRQKACFLLCSYRRVAGCAAGLLF
jgi:hypothetical protein